MIFFEYRNGKENWVVWTSKEGIDYINKVLDDEWKKYLNDQKKKEESRRNRKK